MGSTGRSSPLLSMPGPLPARSRPHHYLLNSKAMELSNEHQLAREIIQRSVSDEWQWAKTEWVLDHIYFDLGFSTCLCGHYPIKEICVLRNILNGNRTRVGNICVKRFMGIRSDRLFTPFRRIQHNLAASLDQHTIDYAHDQHWINDWEYNFYCDTIRKRNLSDRQRNKRTQINEKIRTKITRERINEQIHNVVPGSTQLPGNSDTGQHNAGAGTFNWDQPWPPR